MAYNKALNIASHYHALLGRPTAGAFGRQLIMRWALKEMTECTN